MSISDIKALGLNPDLWDFPKSHSIKAIGLTTDQIESVLISILNDMHLTYDLNSLKSTPSKNNKYTSVTVKTMLKNETEASALYKALFQHLKIIRAL